jgi:beta-glucosidase
LLAVVAAAVAAAAVAAPAVRATGHHSTEQGTARTLPHHEPRLPVEQRFQDLLSRMTPAEKIGQITQAEPASADTDTSKITTDNRRRHLARATFTPTIPGRAGRASS